MIDRSRQEVRSKKLELRQHLVAAITDEQRLYQRHTDAVREAERWHQRAKLALGKGLEDLAREALVRANQHSARATDFERQYLEQKSYVERTKSRLRALESGVQPVSQLRPSSNPKVERSLARLEQQEERAREERARLAALAELERDPLSERLAELEREDLLERQLAELKQKLGR